MLHCKRSFSSVPRVITLKTTPPNVYHKINQELLNNRPAPDAATPDHRMAIVNARALLLGKKNREHIKQIIGSNDGANEQVEEGVRDEVHTTGFMSRLMKDGGDKTLKVFKTYIHLDYTRFIEPCGEIKGLSLDDALLQLEWGKKMISLNVKDALNDAIIKAKKHGFNLSNTYIAEAYVKESAHGLSQRFQSKYLRGRGRYGATPHPKTARLEIILQERTKGFTCKEQADPLEWLRVRLRNKKKDLIKTAENIAELKTFQPKQIFH